MTFAAHLANVWQRSSKRQSNRLTFATPYKGVVANNRSSFAGGLANVRQGSSVISTREVAACAASTSFVGAALLGRVSRSSREQLLDSNPPGLFYRQRDEQCSDSREATFPQNAGATVPRNCRRRGFSISRPSAGDPMRPRSVQKTRRSSLRPETARTGKMCLSQHRGRPSAGGAAKNRLPVAAPDRMAACE